MCSKLKSDYPIPFPRSYWVIPGVFLAGEFPGAKDVGEARQKLERLYDAGIRHVINLMEPYEIDHDGNPFDSYKNELTEIAGKQDGRISFSRYPIKDLHIPDADQMAAILDAVDAAIDAHKPVYVHCWGGIGRTGTVVGCFLIRHGLTASRNVLDVIHGLRKDDPKLYRTSPETSAQVKFVASWHKHDAARLIRLDRYLGCLAGLAAGDALGTTLEFKLPGSFSPIDDMIGGGPFRLKPGEWTDDTSMALCLADSLIQCNGFDAADQMKRYCRWREQGYLSSNGTCFDIGGTVSSALSRFQETGDPFAGSTHERSAGNGSIMRLAPAPLFYAGHPETAIRMSAESSKTTHGARTCIDACRYLGGLIIGALTGESKETLLGPRYTPEKNLWAADPLCPEIDEIARGSFKKKNPPEIKGTGYVVQSLEAALWAFYHSSCFEDGCLMAVNLGDDADTTGAVYGQLAGAFYGLNNIPPKWRDTITHKELIADFAVKLWVASKIVKETAKIISDARYQQEAEYSDSAVYRKVLLMVHELHKKGYQKLRIAPGMAPSGLHWRCAVTPVINISSNHGAQIGLKKISNALIANYSSANENAYFGWVDYDDEPASHLADIFARSHREIVDAGYGQDQNYADWYEQMLDLTAPDLFPIAYADWDLPRDHLNVVSPKGPKNIKIPLPPLPLHLKDKTQASK